MLSKCANPGCSAAFLYLSRGQLFRWETTATSHSATFGIDPQTKSTSRRLEFFWLCEECVPHMTLVYEKGRGVVVRPVMRAKAVAASTSGQSERFVG